MVGFILSTIVGLLNRVLYTRLFGTSADLDAFLAANRLPDILFNLIAGGALASAFIPTFSELLVRDTRERAWQLASSLINIAFITLLLASSLAWIFAPWLVQNILAPGFEDAEQVALTVSLLRVQLIAPVIFGISGLLMAILNTHQKFTLPAFAPTFHWLGWIAGTVFLVPRMGIEGMAWGVVLGAAAHLAIQLPGLRNLGGGYSAVLRLRDEVVQQVGKLLAPRLIGVSVVQMNFLVNTILASAMIEGSLTGISLGFSVMMMPQIVIAQSLAIAALPTLSALMAEGKVMEMRKALSQTIRSVLFLALPASLGLIFLRRPVVALLFERGQFDAHSTSLVAWAVMWYSAGLIGHSLLEVLVRGYYAMKDTRTPVLIGAGAMALNILLSLILSKVFSSIGWAPHGGLALANSLATALETAILFILLNRRLGGMDMRGIRGSLLTMFLSATLMSAFLWAWTNITSERGVLLVTVGGVFLGAVIYAGTSLILKSREARALIARV
jgi:putative peptidoglycan lipid II flippase